MKILVIEDKKMHREAAEQTLQGHELTIVSSYNEAMKLLQPKVNREEFDRLKEAEGLNYPKDREAPDFEERYEAYSKRYDELEKQCRPKVDFDVVLSDMMMPMSSETLGPGVYRWDEEVPYGFIIALVAAQAGVKFIAVVTDTNHHKGAISAALDKVGPAYNHGGFKPNFVINGAQAMFIHTPFLDKVTKDAPCDYCDASGICNRCHGTGQTTDRDDEAIECWTCRKEPGVCSQCQGTGKYDKHETTEMKDWGQVLKDLTEPASESDQD